MTSHKKPCLLLIIDGWGINKDKAGNAYAMAKTPHLDRLIEHYPHTPLLCSGEAVGLPKGSMGNSEVGHLNIGAGRVVPQDLSRINRAIEDGSFFLNPALNQVMDKVKAKGSALHLMGLLSDGGVHSHIHHLAALIDMAHEKQIRVHIHPIMDGRDTPPDSGREYMRRLKELIRGKETIRIATVCGRFYAMDRDKRWDRIEKAFGLYARGEGIRETDPEIAIENAYQRNESDEFIPPTVIADSGHDPDVMANGDGLLFFNFRADRAREIIRVFADESFDLFPADPKPTLCDCVCMTPYDPSLPLPAAFPPDHVLQTLGETISQNNIPQLRIAETEKYAHVTYFFNGGREEPFPLEERLMIPSPRQVRTYDLKPEMSAFELTDAVISSMDSNRFDLIVMNFANMDMVGHTGIIPAAIKACEAVDACVRRVTAKILSMGGAALITSDHGNAEKMSSDSGGPHTAHTLNPVWFILADDSRKNARLNPGALADIAPTVLDVMGLEKPAAMTGKSLIRPVD